MGSRVRRLGENVSGRAIEDRAMETAGYGDGANSGHVRTGTRILLGGFALLTLGAASQLLLFGGSTDRYFAWTITVEPMAGFLGAAYAAGFVLSVLSLRQARWESVRVTVVAVTASHHAGPCADSHSPAQTTPNDGWTCGAFRGMVVADRLSHYSSRLRCCAHTTGRLGTIPPVRHLKPMPLWLVALIGSQGVIMAGVGEC